MIFSDELIRVEIEISEIPWVKIFAKNEAKELSDCDERTKNRLFAAAMITERAMREFYEPDKINWASFGNQVPKVHIHIQARFKDDSFFPEPMWGAKQREGVKRDLNYERFVAFLNERLNFAQLSSIF